MVEETLLGVVVEEELIGRRMGTVFAFDYFRTCSIASALLVLETVKWRFLSRVCKLEAEL